MPEKQMRGFEDLECYQLGRQVFRDAYRLAGLLPPAEKYNLSDQLRRAAASIMLNIAEGYGRYHFLDSLRFYYIARGSIMEVLSAFIACDDLGYAEHQIADQRQLCHHALRSLNGYIRYVKEQHQGIQEYGGRVMKEESLPYSIDEDHAN